MPQISMDLYTALLERLKGDDLGDRLVTEARPDAGGSNARGSVTLTVPLRFAAHAASAMSVGAATSMMCSEGEEVVSFQSRCAEMLRSELPAAFEIFLHRSDVGKMITLMTSGVLPVLKAASWSGGKSAIVFPVGGRDRDFWIRREFEDKMRDLDFVTNVHAQLLEFAERATPMSISDAALEDFEPD